MGDATLSAQCLRYELNRLSTFQNWPVSAPVSSERLARAGFYYSGCGQEVECFECHVKLTDWNYNDQAAQKHREASPGCKFLMGSSNNVPLSLSARRPSVVNENGLAEIVTPSQLSKNGRSDMIWSKFKTLFKESERLKTFRGWPLSFISPQELAKAGFFYLRQKDLVQCIFCKGIILDWEQGDAPMNEHARHFPRCVFVQGNNSGNISMDDEMALPEADHGNELIFSGMDVTGVHTWDMAMGSVPERQERLLNPVNEEPGIYYHGEAKYPMYATPAAREKTFERWPKTLPLTPHSMVFAGFFYAGISDHVKCFCCGGGLRNWEVDDDPWIEHARWYNSCNFVMFMKGNEFVAEAVKKKPPVLINSQNPPSFMTKTNNKPITNGFHYSEQPISDCGNLEKCGASPCVNNRNCEEVSTTLEAMHLSKSSDELSKKIFEENRTLKEMRLCKICMDEEVGVVLRPCGHVVSCVNCAPALTDCPICRKPITTSIRVFFS